jgi:ribosomal protein L40E
MSAVLRWVRARFSQSTCPNCQARTQLNATRCYSCFARMEGSQP